MNSGFVVVFQRTANDYAICCTAMALRLPYEEIRKAAGHGREWDTRDFYAVFEAFGYSVMFQPRSFKPALPAIISVPCRIGSNGSHTVFYDQGRLFDPTVRAEPYSLRSALVEANGFYQWEPARWDAKGEFP